MERVLKSVMATNAGEHVGGSYLQGLQADRIAREGIFPIEDLDGDIPTEWGALASMEQVQPEDTSWPEGTVQRHYSDVPRKLCTTCHLWSRGLADRGVAGYEGSYRSEGCAACHFVYADDGLSRSGDSLIDHTEVGHPIVHQITKQIPTQQCAHCHTRGVRIGLSFQGLAQLPPDTPKGGGYVGLTEEPRYGDFLIENAATHPMDIHAERGMHCIDCHVREEIMGDGNLYGHMDQAVQIECTDWHGTVDDYGTGVTERGAVHDNLEWQNGLMLLTGKVNGGIHIVPQVKDIVDPTSVFYNESAAAAMNHDHIKVDGGLECYACHAGWQNNCYGCHFFRDLDETQLDTLAGMETHGLVETGDKYFTDFNNFQMGWNADGKIAPFMASCQVITNVQDATDELIMEQVLPVSGAGLSGLAMNPEQPHTIRPTPRGCVECHRNPAALGLGTENFNLARKYIFVLTSPAGSFSIIDREADFGSGGGGGPKSPGRDSHVVGTIPLPNPKDLAVMTDPIHGVTDWVYVVDGLFGLVVIDCSDPTTPCRLDGGTARDGSSSSSSSSRMQESISIFHFGSSGQKPN